MTRTKNRRPRNQATRIRWLISGGAVLLSLPLLPAPFCGLYLWASPYLFLNAWVSGSSLRLLHALALGTLVPLLFRKRWLCRFACPLGALCDLSSRASSTGMRTRSLALNRWLRGHLNRGLAVASLVLAAFGVPVLMILDPFNLFFMGWDPVRTGLAGSGLWKALPLIVLLLFNFLHPGLWCAGICPLGGMQEMLFSLRRSLAALPVFQGPGSTVLQDSGRRTFLTRTLGAGVAGGLAVLAGRGLLPRLFGRSRQPNLRPPSALPEEDLGAVCIRCGSCAAACPSGIIGASTDLSRPALFLVPELSFSDSYCLPTCTDCGRVCPSGALAPFGAEDKTRLPIGHAVLQPAGCLLQTGKECSLCLQSCDFDAIRIPSGLPGSNRLPLIDSIRCVGCGACQVVCPPGVIRIEPITRS
ncbi:MAG: 4Fe-4S dicluster domain-containing protein [Bacteroidales bacterium]